MTVDLFTWILLVNILFGSDNTIENFYTFSSRHVHVKHVNIQHRSVNRSIRLPINYDVIF